MPYGELEYNDSLINAMAQQRQMQQQQAMIDQAMNQNMGMAGGAGVLGKALMGLRQGYLNKKSQEADTDVMQQIKQMQAQQKEALQQQAEAKRQQELERKDFEYQRQLKDQQASKMSDREFQAEQASLNRGAQAGRFNQQQTIEAQRHGEKMDMESKKGLYKKAEALRKEFQNLKPVKDFDEVNTSFRKVANSAKDPNPATDIALITGFMKMNDPGSTVREGEFKTAADAGSANQRFWGLYQSLKSGERLTPEQRDYFVNSSQRLYQTHADQYNRMREQYGSLAEKSGLNPEDVFIKRDIYKQEDKEAPQVNIKKLAESYTLEELMQMKAQAGGQ